MTPNPEEIDAALEGADMYCRDSTDTVRVWARVLADEVRRLRSPPAAPQSAIGKVLSEEEMGTGYDRKAGNVIWFGKPPVGPIYSGGAAPQQAVAWQPIETAPMDDSSIILWDGITVGEGHYDLAEKLWLWQHGVSLYPLMWHELPDPPPQPAPQQEKPTFDKPFHKGDASMTTPPSAAPTPAGAELLPCAHCGHSAAPTIEWSSERDEFDYSNEDSVTVICDASEDNGKGPGGCGASGGYAPTEAEAIAKWNRRAPSAAAAAAGPGEGWHAWYRKGREHLIYFKHCGDPVPCGDMSDVVWLTPAMSDKDYLRLAVDRFLAWRLPEDFTPDCYVSFDKEKARRNNGWPVGTNLLTATQAEAMLRHVLAAPAQPTFGHDDLPLLDTPEKIKAWLDEKPILKARLGEQPVAPQPGSKADEPVAWMSQGGDVSRSRKRFEDMGFTDLIPLYSTPQPTPHQPAAALMELARKFRGSAEISSHRIVGDTLISCAEDCERMAHPQPAPASPEGERNP